ncbi:MAG TPA: hypothetical protein VMU39_09630 [Solirubrobacteraceae bacterium]|nr:hypothetical protein [Solirubrobacteraceae bacterium]
MRTSSVLAAAAVIGAAALPATAAAKTSNTQLFQNPSKTAVCGIEIHAKNTPATELLCSATGIPRAKHGVGDPFVQISATGSPQLVLLSQNSFVSSNNPKTLSKGTLWSSLGVACNIGSNTILCFNGDNRGFVIGNKKYTSF